MNYLGWYLCGGLVFASLAVWQEGKKCPRERRGTDWIFFVLAVVMLTLTWPFWLLKAIEVRPNGKA